MESRAHNASTELQRRCNRCGNEWYLSHKQGKEKAPKRGEMGLASFGSLVGHAKQRNVQAARLTALELKKQRVDAVAACPSCGSLSYPAQVIAI